MKEKILDAAEEMVQDRGLSSVSFQDLANAVGLRKASIFHHFPNKEAVAIGLIERCATKHGPEYEEVVESDLSAPDKLKKLAKIFDKGLKQRRPCLIAALGGGLNSLTEVSSEELKKTAKAAVARFALVFEQGTREGSLEFEGKPENAAMAFFAMLQGLQVLARASKNLSSFLPAALTYIDSITRVPKSRNRK